ncbi:hypothetical protein Xaut_4479 [Xanthobacter versatilis]|uniref:Uncharacterized protein n=1 Tax=Xanthobacter autotrophicus (strain ATCC BAA-1158 / Py2) TaxID=78245 RepID=A7INV4_XANP2|nr:hypothetical protein Xaut_4479 [Xanthobacter autotrophicus Py2]
MLGVRPHQQAQGDQLGGRQIEPAAPALPAGGRRAGALQISERGGDPRLALHVRGVDHSFHRDAGRLGHAALVPGPGDQLGRRAGQLGVRKRRRLGRYDLPGRTGPARPLALRDVGRRGLYAAGRQQVDAGFKRRFPGLTLTDIKAGQVILVNDAILHEHPLRSR